MTILAVQQQTGFADDELRHTCVFADPDCRSSKPVTFLEHRTPWMMHPGDILTEVDGVGVFAVAPGKERTTVGLVFAPEPLPADPRRRQLLNLLARDRFPVLAATCPETHAKDLIAQLTEIAYRVVELRHHGWQVKIIERRRNTLLVLPPVRYDTSVHLVNPDTEQTEVQLPMRITRHASDRLATVLDQLRRLPDTPNTARATSRAATLHRLREHTDVTLAQTVSEQRIRLAVADLLAADPDADVEHVVTRALQITSATTAQSTGHDITHIS